MLGGIALDGTVRVEKGDGRARVIGAKLLAREGREDVRAHRRHQRVQRRERERQHAQHATSRRLADLGSRGGMNGLGTSEDDAGEGVKDGGERRERHERADGLQQQPRGACAAGDAATRLIGTTAEGGLLLRALEIDAPGCAALLLAAGTALLQCASAALEGGACGPRTECTTSDDARVRARHARRVRVPIVEAARVDAHAAARPGEPAAWLAVVGGVVAARTRRRLARLPKVDARVGARRVGRRAPPVAVELQLRDRQHHAALRRVRCELGAPRVGRRHGPYDGLHWIGRANAGGGRDGRGAAFQAEAAAPREIRVRGGARVDEAQKALGPKSCDCAWVRTMMGVAITMRMPREKLLIAAWSSASLYTGTTGGMGGGALAWQAAAEGGAVAARRVGVAARRVAQEVAMAVEMGTGRTWRGSA